MKKLGAVSMALFYLLLTTGAFACLLHCSGAFITTGLKQGFVDGHADCPRQMTTMADMRVQHMHGGKCKSKPAKDCGCCDKHGAYLVKENINPADVLLKMAMPVAILPANYDVPAFQPRYLVVQVAWPQTTGPPATSQPPIYLSVRCLLI